MQAATRRYLRSIGRVCAQCRGGEPVAAVAARSGLDASTIRAIEAGRFLGSHAKVIALATACGLTLATLYRRALGQLDAS